jgi:phage baseplate assembly protein W
MSIIGVSWPWDGFPEWVNDDDAIEPAMHDVLFTASGERKMNIDYGSQLLQIVFENKGRVMKSLATREIVLACQANLPLVSVSNVDVVTPESDTEPVDITVWYEYQGVPGVATFEVPTP